MSIRWRQLAGDTSTFAIEVTFLEDPDCGKGATPEIAASWGSFRIWCNGLEPTASARSGYSSEGVTWYLLPLLEWFAKNWDALFHEERLPVRVAGDTAAFSLAHTHFPTASASDEEEARWEADWDAWWNRHSIQAAREGGLFSDLLIRRWREKIEVSWEPTSIAGDRRLSRFAVPAGVARVDATMAADALHRVLAGAVAFLQTRCPKSDRFHRLVQTLDRLASAGEARQTSRYSWLAGLSSDPKEASDRWTELMGIFKQEGDAGAAALRPTDTGSLLVSGSCHASLMFGSAAPSLTHDDVVELAQAIVRAWDPTVASAEIDRHSNEVAVGRREQAWEQGYELAEQFREALALEDVELPDVPKLLRQLGIQTGQIALNDRALRGVSIAGDGFVPTILVNERLRQRKARERFTLAHELCHFLVDRESSCRLALASGPWAPNDVERRANAFAAAFLMPWAAIQRIVAGLSVDIDSTDGVFEIASALNTSFMATLERLHDLGFLDESQRDSLRDEVVQ